MNIIDRPLNSTTISGIFNINCPDISIDDLLSLAYYLEINDKILGIDIIYMRGIHRISKGENKKRKNKKTKDFFNQLTFILNIGDSLNIIKRNVKLFVGGSLHVCGCKNLNDFSLIFDIIKDLLQNINIPISKHVYPFVYINNTIIGVEIDNIKYLHGEIVKKTIIYDESRLVSIKFNVFSNKNIYDLDGNKIGIITKIGKRRNFTEQLTYVDTVKPQNSFNLLDKIQSIKLSEINITLMNYTFKYNFDIDKNKLYTILKKKMIFTIYEPVVYHALKMMYYFGVNADNGICKCLKLNKTGKCDCQKTTLLICTNGNILMYGFRSYNQIEFIYNYLNNIIINDYL